MTGCAAALALAEAGLGVRLHDAREIAGGASGRNGGFALRGGAGPYDVTAESIGRGPARELWRRTEGALDRIESLAGDAFRRTGSLRLAADDEECEALRIEYELLREDGFAAEWVEEPLDGRFRAAILHPCDAALQPARWVRRLAVLAAEAGVEIREHSRVESLAEADADAGPRRDRRLSERPPRADRGPDRAHARPDDRDRAPARACLRCMHYGRHGFDYWQQTPDGRILAGGFRDWALESEFTAVEETTPRIQGALESFVAELVGRPIEVTHRWAGIFGLVLDFLPVVGRVPGEERVWVAGGYSGHGNVLGLLCGELVAQAMLGREAPELALFDPARLL